MCNVRVQKYSEKHCLFMQQFCVYCHACRTLSPYVQLMRIHREGGSMHYKEIILFMHLHTKKYSLQLRLEPTLLQNIHDFFFR